MLNMKNYIFKNDLLFQISKIEMNLLLELALDILPSDIWRLILLISKINVIKIISSTNKYFYSLCGEKNLWLEKFKEKDLVIINDKIITAGEYLNEYRKVSYSTYTTNCLINMEKLKGCYIPHCICWFNYNFVIDDLFKILPKDNIIFDKMKKINNYIEINIMVGDKGSIDYNTYEKLDKIKMTKIMFEKYDNNNIIISLISKILYYYPLIEITDINDEHVIIFKNLKVDNPLDIDYIKRKEYWDQCYSKYEELYF